MLRDLTANDLLKTIFLITNSILQEVHYSFVRKVVYIYTAYYQYMLPSCGLTIHHVMYIWQFFYADIYS